MTTVLIILFLISIGWNLIQSIRVYNLEKSEREYKKRCIQIKEFEERERIAEKVIEEKRALIELLNNELDSIGKDDEDEITSMKNWLYHTVIINVKEQGGKEKYEAQKKNIEGSGWHLHEIRPTPRVYTFCPTYGNTVKSYRPPLYYITFRREPYIFDGFDKDVFLLKQGREEI